jgi:pyruvate-formate lyase-activating enzyme
LPEGSAGKCGLYLNQGGKIVERYPDKYLIISPITIETMSLLHFHPREKFLQVSTVGCNFDCPGCISTVIAREMDPGQFRLLDRKPEEIVREAAEKECLGISFLMNDPLASWPTFVNVAKKAKENGLLVGCSSNAFFTESSLAQILPYLDFINIGIKGFSEQIYRQCGARSAKPVWRNIEILYKSGVHVEVSCMYRRNEEKDLLGLARKIARISPDIPLQVMRFIPMEDADPALETSIREAEEACLALQKWLRYVYLFNSPGTDYLTTYCPNCGKWVFKRDFYGPMGARLKSSRVKVAGKVSCALCGTVLPFRIGKMRSQTDCFREADFEGGYPFTRALEILESIAITVGINNKGAIVQVWNDYANQKVLHKLHRDVQNPDTFISLIRSIGASIGRTGEASKLVDYLESILSEIKEKSAFIQKRPRVYYAMGKPLFCIKGERMENQLVEIAGGISMNKKLEIIGRPGETIPVDQLNRLNPEVIFISAFISSSVDDFYEDCVRTGVRTDAVKNRRIYAHPAPGWDFGSPRWVLGLMYIANALHPDLFQFDILSEADKFYRKFYNSPFLSNEINRSFSKPSSTWRFATAK